MSGIAFAYIYVSSPSTTTDLATGRKRVGYVTGGGLDGLKNRVFFTFLFFEMLSWFWTWITLREERDGMIDKEKQQSRREQSRREA